jgi:hypothetical protein
MSRSSAINLELHDKQAIALETSATEVLFGGAAGGGKSHLMRVAALLWCAAIPGLQVYLFRRIREDLIKTHIEGPRGFRALLGPWTLSGFAKIVNDEIRFWNGSRIYLCHCKDEKDVYKYLSAEMHVLLIDELTQFTETMYRFLRNRVRMVGVTLPANMAGKFPRILASSNPGNIGHLFAKQTFVDGTETYDIRQMSPDEGGMRRQFIPALLEDNPSMSSDDPGYENRLLGLGSEALVKAMRFGDWDIVEGAFFDCWNKSRHVIRPLEVPAQWMRFRSMDWGSAKPFSVGWWAVASDQHEVTNTLGDKLIIPRGCMVREWYGSSKPNVGLKLHAEVVADGIKEREKGDTLAYGVLDPAAFAEDGGKSIAQRMAERKVYFRPADNARVARVGAMGGWDQMRARLVGDGDGKPMIVCFSTCLDSIRTIPSMQHDQARPEDMDSNLEDHAADEWRYACMSRPWIKTVKEKPKVRVKDGYERAGGQESDGYRVI